MSKIAFDKAAVIDFFNNLAPNWESGLIRNDEILNKILDNAKIKENDVILDVATGTGILIPYLLNRNVSRIVAIDISSGMIKVAKSLYNDPKIEFICEDVENNEFNEKFDSIIVYNAFPHFSNQDNLVKILSNLLKKGGTLTVAHGMSQENINKHHANVKNVSLGLMNIEELNIIFSKYINVICTISNSEMYQIVGKK